jgi:hypothetical protein
MKSMEFIVERKPTDTELKVRGWSPNTKHGNDQEYKDWVFSADKDIESAPGPVGFTALQAIKDILGADNVCADDEEPERGQYYVIQGHRPGAYFIAMDDYSDGGVIELPFDQNSNQARRIATAVHEAFHAYVHRKIPGGSLYNNEKMVNSLSVKWLQKHLTGYNLHIALEQITKSRISYGDKMGDAQRT